MKFFKDANPTNMMSKEQVEVVKTVYTRLMEYEEQTWTEIDDNLAMCGGMSDLELIKECKIKYKKDSRGIFRCVEEHDLQHCLAPLILESVGAILSLYDETKSLHKKNAYVLTYYLVMTELKMIYSI